jgi:hypothetical protein
MVAVLAEEMIQGVLLAQLEAREEVLAMELELQKVSAGILAMTAGIVQAVPQMVVQVVEEVRLPDLMLTFLFLAVVRVVTVQLQQLLDLH